MAKWRCPCGPVRDVDTDLLAAVDHPHVTADRVHEDACGRAHLHDFIAAFPYNVDVEQLDGDGDPVPVPFGRFDGADEWLEVPEGMRPSQDT